ncbi:VirC2 family conjugal transfer protein [Rhizobium puerariae]|uniref:VirC2 family conjugal transfer protein n=1 Tax=Rhizobium puerariae TaxID=1585791 RepID=A0ABV6AMM2_9HYPH
MGIRKPSLTVSEARRLAETRSATSRAEAEAIAPDGSQVRPAAQNPAPQPTTPPPAAKRLDGPVERRAPPPRKETEPAPAPPSDSGGRAGAIPYPRALMPVQGDKVQVFISAPLPAPGVSAIYEILCRQYPSQKALQMVLRRALHDYEAMLENGSFQTSPEAYAVDQAASPEDFIQTSRMMPKALVGIARAHFDPLGLESTRSFGRKLANAALASFFAREAAGR